MRTTATLIWMSFLFTSFAIGQQPIATSISQPPNGALRGRVVDESGKAVGGAQVTLYHFQAVQGRGQQATTKSDGSFAIDQLPSGDYGNCVTVPSSDYVDDCKWNLTFLPRIMPGTNGSKPSIVSVPNGSAKLSVAVGNTDIQQLQVKKGARVVIQFTDPGKKVDDSTHLTVGFLGPRGMMIPAVRTKSASGISFEQVVPFDTETKVLISSFEVQAKSASGSTDLASGMGYAMSVKVASSTKSSTLINFDVTGKKAR